ncbi:MAG: winged helix-turn-helix domain-containing protein [Planctomycetota bacterium]|nr:winged helix-turn-helix domain-containing protein [Planctomycetota bacterium]
MDGRAISLTPHEYHLVEALQGENGHTLSRSELLERGWEGGGSVGSNVIDVAIQGLRKKLGKRSDMIETVRGAGCRWKSWCGYIPPPIDFTWGLPGRSPCVAMRIRGPV